MGVFRRNAEDATSSLVAAIYEAALDPSKWQNFVDALPRELDGIEPVLYIADNKSAMMETLLVSDNWGRPFVDAYLAHFDEVNPWTPSLADGPDVGQVVRGDELIGYSDLKETEFYVDFFKEYGDWLGVAGVIAYRDAHAFSVLGLHGSEELFEKEREKLVHVTAILGSHIARALKINRQLQRGAAARISFENMLEHLVGAVLLIDADLRVVHCSRDAEALFNCRLLSLNSDGRIAAGAGSSETRALRRALRAALRPIPEITQPSAITLTCPVDEEGQTATYLAHISPWVNDANAQAGSPRLVPLIQSETNALMLVTDPTARLRLRSDWLQALFDLTPAEARLAQALASGTSLEAYAVEANVSVNTARTQLKSVFAKTNTHRQAELVALLAQLAPPFPRC